MKGWGPRVWGRELGWQGAWTQDRGAPTVASSCSSSPHPRPQLEQALDTQPGQLGGPGGLIVSALQDPSLSPSRSRAVLCVLGALVGKRTPWAGAGGRAGFPCWLGTGSPGQSRHLPVSNHLAKPPVPEVSYYPRTPLVSEAPPTPLTDCDLGKLRGMEWSYQRLCSTSRAGTDPTF